MAESLNFQSEPRGTFAETVISSAEEAYQAEQTKIGSMKHHFISSLYGGIAEGWKWQSAAAATKLNKDRQQWYPPHSKAIRLSDPWVWQHQPLHAASHPKYQEREK